MAYDQHGRWVPSEDINWDLTPENRDALRLELTATGLDWRHEGKYAFRTSQWGQMSESQRLGVLQHYDSWYDEGGQIDLEDEAWGLDIEREVTYNSSWDAQTAFHELSGGTGTYEWIQKTKDQLQNPENYRDKVRHTIVGSRVDEEGKEWTQIIKREYPMNWREYTNDELYRATIDELLEQDYMMFMGPGSDFDNATQVRAATKEIKSWINEAYTKAHELGKDGAWAEAEWNKYKALQIQQARVHNVRYPEGRNTRGFQHNQQVAIRRYQPWNKFDPETGTRTKLNPLTGEIRDTFKHKQVPEPTRMSIVGNRLDQNIDEGIFYSSTFGLEQEITDSMLEKPPSIPRPNLSIRGVTPERPDTIDADWKLKGETKVTTQGGER
jgi:hypothetical protein